MTLAPIPDIYTSSMLSTMRYYCHGYYCYGYRQLLLLLWLWLSWLLLFILCDPLQPLFSRNSQLCLRSNPAAYRHNTYRKIWAVPRMASNCAFPKIFGSLNLPYQAFAFPEIVPSEPITMGFIVTLVALWFLLISWARSWYLSTFSCSVVRILVRWHRFVDMCPLLCVFVYYSNIGAIGL